MEKPDLAVIGMTFAGAGAALSCPGSSVVLESKFMPGYEFSDCICPAPDLSGEYHGLCRELQADFFNAGLSERPFSPGWTPYFSEFLLKHDCNVLFYTDVINIAAIQGGFVLTLCQNGEKSEIFAKEVIDTRTAKPVEVCLRGCVCSPEPLSDFEGFTVTALGQNMYILSLAVSPETSLSSARQDFFSRFGNRHVRLSSARILTVADVFACRSGYERRLLPNGVLSLPSDYSPDLFDAFERGMRAGGQK